MSAMVVWLYNDFLTQEEFKRMQGIYNDPRNVKDRTSAQQSIGRAMKIEPYGLKGNGGISDEQAEFNGKVSIALASGVGTVSSVAVFGVKTTAEIIVHIMINYYSINHEGRVRYRGSSAYTREKQMIEVEKKGINNLLKKVIIWIPKP